MATYARTVVLFLALIAFVATASAVRMDPAQSNAGPGREQVAGCPMLEEACEGGSIFGVSFCNPDDTAVCYCTDASSGAEWMLADICRKGEKCVEERVPQTTGAYCAVV